MSRALNPVIFGESLFEGPAIMIIPQTGEHHLLLSKLDDQRTLADKTSYVHGVVRQRFPCIDRIAIAKYDQSCDTLRTLVGSMQADNPLILYEAKLSDVPSLLNLVRTRETRVVNDMSIFAGSNTTHSKQILGKGFISSYTVPLFNEGEFIGVLFFNSYQRGAFDDSNLGYLDMIAHLLTSLMAAELAQISTLRGALKTATQFTHHRDPETGMHLERMARYSRLIARKLGASHQIDDEFADRIFQHAPLHDVGKIAIPDKILLKPGPLSVEEFAEMKTHTTRGREIIDSMLLNFNIKNAIDISMIRNIVAHHHESIDGNGYPDGLTGNTIPLEARIVAVADVFDALTSERPYKKAWSNHQAFVELDRLSHFKLDPDCVAVLLGSQDEIQEIQSSFTD
jgi:HD-GYP domain-containing protein (c-di-GMP phosphodiesterase class II)